MKPISTSEKRRRTKKKMISRTECSLQWLELDENRTLQHMILIFLRNLMAELFCDRKLHILITGSGVSPPCLVKYSGGGDGMPSTSGLKLTLLTARTAQYDPSQYLVKHPPLTTCDNVWDHEPGSYYVLRNTMNWQQIAPAPAVHWMFMSYTGLVIAQRFGVIVHLFSSRGPQTIFSLWTSANSLQRHNVVSVVHLGVHFINVTLQGYYPMPTVNPIWKRYRNDVASDSYTFITEMPHQEDIAQHGPPLDPETLALLQHKWLQFEAASAVAIRCRHILRMSMGMPRCIDWGVLADAEEAVRARAILHKDMPWTRFFELAELPSYRLITDFLTHQPKLMAYTGIRLHTYPVTSTGATILTQ
ncbi:hypothetical protein E3N88_22589 [Mikania micrantha]|uniref:Uncharacterized protein n=1 Tax=Mikania micrantha TaxID=192012 RepID=A0A5N6NDE9_9ASTR|nr:hypothetical protein E3N88_22589 [Mikania micrantha]